MQATEARRLTRWCPRVEAVCAGALFFGIRSFMVEVHQCALTEKQASVASSPFHLERALGLLCLLLHQSWENQTTRVEARTHVSPWCKDTRTLFRPRC